MTKQIRSIKDEKEAWLKLLENKDQPTKTKPTKNPKTLDLKKYRLSKKFKTGNFGPKQTKLPNTIYRIHFHRNSNTNKHLRPNAPLHPHRPAKC